MKINKTKLNSLLKSGLNPEVTTRKQLAQHLGLDPTSLTRWFATSDRLGNPRYPVVPDRHVAKIVELFSIQGEVLNLADEEFRQHCFNQSLAQNKTRNTLEQKDQDRLEKALARKLTLQNYPPNKAANNQFIAIGVGILTVAGVAWLLYDIINERLQPTSHLKYVQAVQTADCWQGYSAELGTFDNHDIADPCDYAKLFTRALSQLKQANDDKSDGSVDTADRDYLLFLSQQLDNRRNAEKIILNIELAKSELRRADYKAAEVYLNKAVDLQTQSSHDNAMLSSQIMDLQSQINALVNSIK